MEIFQDETYLFLVLGGLFAHLGKLIGWVASSTDGRVLSGPWLLLLLTVDTSLSVIKDLGVGDWLLEVAASLWNMLLDNGSISKQDQLD